VGEVAGGWLLQRCRQERHTHIEREREKCQQIDGGSASGERGRGSLGDPGERVRAGRGHGEREVTGWVLDD
jgi:hypothetical protein